jgi:hypothetical protein
MFTGIDGDEGPGEMMIQCKVTDDEEERQRETQTKIASGGCKAKVARRYSKTITGTASRFRNGS